MGEDIAAALNIDRTKGKIIKGAKRISICESSAIFGALGIPQGLVYTNAYTLRKIKKDHHLTKEQIEKTPELIADSVAVFNDHNKAYILLTDILAPDLNWRIAPVMVYLRPDEGGNYIASEYAKTENGETQYISLKNEGLLMYIDENRAAHLPLGGEVKSSLITFNRGGNVKTPEDLSSLSSPTSIPYSGAGAQGENVADGMRRLTTPFKPGENSARFSLGGNTDEIAALVIAREILETGRAPSSANVWAVKESLRASGSTSMGSDPMEEKC